ncbi:MAG: DNA polymerase domain-containing protein [Promethearchaeota archaeon]
MEGHYSQANKKKRKKKGWMKGKRSGNWEKKKKKKKITNGWSAAVQMMRDAGCTCDNSGGGGELCYCHSYPWMDDYDVQMEEFAQYRRDPIVDTNVYKKSGFEFFLSDMNYEVSSTSTILRLYGITRDQHSVFCEVSGYNPYFYIEFEKELSEVLVTQCIEKMRRILELSYVKQTQIKMKRIENMMTTHMYNKHPIKNLYKVIVKIPGNVSKLRKAMQDDPIFRPLGLYKTRVYESNVDFVLRFCVDHKMSGTSLLRIDYNKCIVIPNSQKKSRCQIELQVESRFIQTVKGNGDELPSFRILSFDIECSNKDKHFPTPEIDPVIQICAVVHNMKTNEQRAIGFTLGTCDPVPNVHILCFQKEKNLLLAWSTFIRTYDPDVMTGYNIDNFDNRYLMERADFMGIKYKYARYTRIKSSFKKGDYRHLADVKEKTFESKAYGKTRSMRHACEGLITMDLLPVLRRSMKFGSYTLNNVSEKILGRRKDDVHHSEISTLFRKDAKGRKILLHYCVEDARLPLLIILQRKIMINTIMMARITGTLPRRLIEKGQTEKVKSQFLSATKRGNFVIPTLEKDEANRRSYVGAYVEHPLPGFYGNHVDTKVLRKGKFQQKLFESLKKKKTTVMTIRAMTVRMSIMEGDNPVTVVDFHSLYPTIMIAYNLCYSTKTTWKEIQKNGWVEDIDYNHTPSGHYFVTQKIRKGILPKILEKLLDARSKAKKAMKSACKEGDFNEESIQNGTQLAIKVSANSVYGFVGAFFYTDRDISESVTLYGQKLIKRVKKEIEARYTKANGYSRDAVVVYGDTDSVFVIFGNTVEESFKVGKEACEWIDNQGFFKKPVSLGFEKVYYPMILLSKKKYFGMKYEKSPFEKPKYHARGIETIRRDNFRFLRNVLKEVNDILTGTIKAEGDLGKIDYAIRHCQTQIMKCANGDVPIEDLIISKALSRPVEEYVHNLPAHVGLVKKLAKRAPGSEPKSGDRVPYVVLEAGKGTKLCDRTEDPEYALKNRCSIDYEYYAFNLLLKAVCRVFGSLVGSNTFEHVFNVDYYDVWRKTFDREGDKGEEEFKEWKKNRIEKETRKVIEANRKEARRLLFKNDKLRVRRRTIKNWGTICKHFLVIPKCVNCKKSLGNKGNKRKRKRKKVDWKKTCQLCKKCSRHRKRTIYQKIKENNDICDQKYAVQMQCRICQGDSYGSITCSNHDCHYFYKGIQLDNDIEDIHNIIKRLVPSTKTGDDDEGDHSMMPMQERIFQNIESIL